ncbi:MAG: hypothetical protein J0L65_03680 [Xanthomonadales bacterium]|nr:hypothetical protein [Xanthomonadales bacterium]
MHSLTTLKRRPAVVWLALALTSIPVLSSAAVVSTSTVGKGELRTICPADGSALVPGQIALVDDGTALRIVAVDSTMSAECAMKATAANLKVRFPGNTQDILLTGPVAYNVLTREVGFGIVEPALCESFYPVDSAPLLQIALTDPDGSTQTLSGISGLEYALPSTARFTPTSASATYGDWVQCHAIPYSTLVNNAPDVPAPGVNVDPGNPDLIFADGMETPASNADLRIEILDDGERFLTRNIQAYIDQPFQYAVRVRNVGNATATGVRLREFTPNAAVVSPPVPMQPRVTIGAWTCQNDAEQSCGTGSGELDVASISLAAGSYRDYTVTREVVTANVGDKVAISTALFFAPNDEVSKGDVSSEDNVASAIVTLLENTGPVITCIDPQIGSGPNSLPNPLNMQEDDDVREFECTMTDAEQDAITNFTASSSNISLVPNDGLLGARAGDTWELFIAPQPEASGSSTVTLTATDARGAQRVMQFTVEVAAVNDPPTFSLFSATVVQSATGDVPTNIVGDPLEGPLQFPTMEANCFDSGNTACTVSISSFIEDVVSGPSNESGQLVQPVTLVAGDCVLASGTGSLSNMFAVLPQLTPASAQASGSDFALAWTYRKNASATLAFTCTMRVQDAGGAQSGGQITFSMGN